MERKGLPVLLRAFEALRSQVPAELVVVGADAGGRRPAARGRRGGVTVLGPVGDDEKHAALAGADVLAAPSLGGESFGMVLTEAFAAGTPVVASDIAGLPRRRGRTGATACSSRAATPRRWREALRGLALDPARTRALGARGGAAPRSATPGRGWPLR